MGAIILFLLLSCGMETQIVGVVTSNDSDTSSTASSQTADTSTTDTVVTGDTSVPEPVLEGTVGYVNYILQQIACPECVGATQEITINFSARFHDSISGSHTSWIPAVGTCVESLVETSPSTNPINVGAQLSAIGPVHSFGVPQVNNGFYQNSSLYETQYDRDATLNISSDVLTQGFSLYSTRGFDYIEPVSLLYVDMSYAYQAPISRSGMTFYWGPSGSGENFMIIVAVYTSTGSSLLGYVTCVGEDIGYMAIPAAYLSGYAPGSLVAVHLSRQRIEQVPAPDLGGYIEAHMEWEVVGTGHIQ